MTPFLKSALIIAVTATALPGCAQIGQAADGLWGGTKSAAKWVSSPFRSKDLRPAPDYRVVESSPYEDGTVELFADTIDANPSYADAGYEVSYVPPTQTYDAASTYTAPYATGYTTGGGYYTASSETSVQSAAIATADSLAFVRLNGESRMSDWQSCEVVHRGYWLIDAAGGRMNPDFEVCMRNKGYVLESELAGYGFQGETPVRAPSPYAGGYRSLP